MSNTVRCNNIPFTLQEVIDYDLKIDNDSLGVVVNLNEQASEFEDQLYEAEVDRDDWEEKHDQEQERADIAVDRALLAENELEKIPELESEIEELKLEVESLQGSNLSRQCKAKDKWIEKLLNQVENLEMINEL